MSRRTRYCAGRGWSAAGAAGCGVTAVAALADRSVREVQDTLVSEGVREPGVGMRMREIRASLRRFDVKTCDTTWYHRPITLQGWLSAHPKGAYLLAIDVEGEGPHASAVRDGALLDPLDVASRRPARVTGFIPVDCRQAIWGEVPRSVIELIED